MKNGKCWMGMEAIALLVVVSILFALVVSVFYLTITDKAASLIDFTENLAYIFAFMMVFVVFAMVRRRGETPSMGQRDSSAARSETAISRSKPATKRSSK